MFTSRLGKAMASRLSVKERNMELVLSNLQSWFGSGKMYGPSYRDIAKATGLPVATVHKTIKMLGSEGRVAYNPNIARSIRLK